MLAQCNDVLDLPGAARASPEHPAVLCHHHHPDPVWRVGDGPGVGPDRAAGDGAGEIGFEAEGEARAVFKLWRERQVSAATGR